MLKNIGLAIMFWNRFIRHQQTQIESKAPIAGIIDDLPTKTSRRGTWVTCLLVLGMILLFLLVFAKAQAATSDEFKSASRTIEQLTNKLNPAVVEIDVRAWGVDDSKDEPERAGYLVHDRTLGTGVLITQGGEILTNHHLIRGAQQITIHLMGSTRGLSAKVIGDDPDTDLALLKIDGSGMPHFELGAAAPVRQGQVVLAIGNPYGFEHSVTLGLISSPARELDTGTPATYIQTDAPINPGNSGGPLVDLDGHLVGINTLIYSSTGGSQGVGFAIPVEAVLRSVAAMEADGSVRRPHLGVSLQLVTGPIAQGLRLATSSGLLVNDVDAAGPAFKSGMEPGDVIISVQGKATPDWKSLQTALDSLHVGEPAVLTIERKGVQSSIVVHPEYEDSRHLGLMDYANVTKNFVEQLGIVGVNLNSGARHLFAATRAPSGVIVAAKCDAIKYDTDELKADDILHQVNGHSVHDVADLRSYLLQTAPDQPLIFQVEREGHLMYIAITPRD